MRHWVFSCKQISALLSLSMDTRLPLYKRLGIRFHLMMCVLCRRYKKQLLFLRSVIRMAETNENEGISSCNSLPSLPEDARKRIEKKLKDKTN